MGRLIPSRGGGTKRGLEQGEAGGGVRAVESAGEKKNKNSQFVRPPAFPLSHAHTHTHYTHTHTRARVMVDTRPAELTADAALDAALDVGLRRLVYGTLAGLAAGALLFREW